MSRLLTRRRRTTHPTADLDAADDPRPRFAIGHIPLTGDDLGVLADFYVSIGMRKVARIPGAAIIELRGGTHLAITSGEPGVGTLDLMVDDLDATHALLASVGAAPTEIRRSFPHRVFTAVDPEGNRLVVHSSHVAGPV